MLWRVAGWPDRHFVLVRVESMTRHVYRSVRQHGLPLPAVYASAGTLKEGASGEGHTDRNRNRLQRVASDSRQPPRTGHTRNRITMGKL
jgi:hypothetical protein